MARLSNLFHHLLMADETPAIACADGRRVKLLLLLVPFLSLLKYTILPLKA